MFVFLQIDGLNKTFIFFYHIQPHQLAFVSACEVDSCECSGQHNRDKSNQWGEEDDIGAELQSGNKASSGVLGRGTMTESNTHFMTLCQPCRWV